MKKAAFLILFLMVFIISCKKDPETVPEGTVRMLITVNHHGFPIPNARVFRKNGATSWPGSDTTLYDTRYVTDANGYLVIDDIGNGTKDLVLYAKGIDPSWDTTVITPVSGYNMFHIATVIGQSKDIDVSLYVSE